MPRERKSTPSKEMVAKLRLQCQTDLFFLGKSVLKKDFTEGTHRAMCDFYVKKDPTFKTFKEFAKQYQGPRDRIQLVPRETYKSSIKVIDNVQWIICWPEIRILTCTSTDDLSGAFIDELVGYFTVRGNARRNPATGLLEGGSPTAFQELFPEHCVSEQEARAGEFETPARAGVARELIYKEPTAGTLSMTSSSSGWHCDVLDYDDPVSDRNSETGTLLEKLDNRISMIFELLMNYGFRHVVGTRYNPHDPYAKMAEDHGITELYGDFERDGLKYMCRPCWWKKGQPYLQPDYSQGCPAEEEVDLFFPEGAPYLALKKKFKKAQTFFSQQLNDPQKASSVEFNGDMIRACMVDHSALPKSGMIFGSWDLASTSRAQSDQSGGIIGMLDDQRRWWIIDIILGRYNFSERCFQIVKSIHIHHPRRTSIENVHGLQENMQEPLVRMSKQLNVPLDLDWICLGKGTADAKYNRMVGLHPWITEKRIFFLNTLPHLDELIRQFSNIRPQGKGRDEIPDAMSRLVEQYTRYATQAKMITSADDDRKWKELEERDLHNMIFRKGRYAAVDVPPPIKEDPRESPSWAIDELFQ